MRVIIKSKISITVRSLWWLANVHCIKPVNGTGPEQMVN